MTDKETDGSWTFDGPDHNIIVWSGPEQRVCFMTSDGPARERARLICAAHDLLKVLQKALYDSGCDGDLCWRQWHEDARNAIAKAKGTSE